MKTMIALVSDQRMQNIIPILQDGVTYDELILVMSKDRQTAETLPKYIEAAEDLKAVLKQYVEVKLSPESVDPYDIEAVASTISTLIDHCDGRDNVVVNISGGTKPMAIGALRAALRARVTSLYTNTEDSEILRLFPDGSIATKPIHVVGLDVELYIRAYGEKVIESKGVVDLGADYKAWAETIGNQHTVIYQKVIVPVTSAIKAARKNKSGFPITCKLRPTRRQREIIERLAQQELWTWDEISGQIVVADKRAASFLHGTWVEVYVAMRMQQSKFFDDVRLNVKLDGVEGEIDVAAVSNGKLVLVECKSNVQQSQQLSKLDSFRRRLGGPYAKAYYARASEAYAKRIRKQCRKIRLNGVFFGAELASIGNEIGKDIGDVI